MKPGNDFGGAGLTPIWGYVSSKRHIGGNCLRWV
jgi:hypothetical protein